MCLLWTAIFIPNFQSKHWIKRICYGMEWLDTRKNRHLKDRKDNNWRTFKQKHGCTYHYIFNRRKANGVFIATDINLPPDYWFNFLEHFIAILPTADTLQYDKRLYTDWCQMKLQTTLNNFNSTTNTWSWTSRAKHCDNQTMEKWHLNTLHTPTDGN